MKISLFFVAQSFYSLLIFLPKKKSTKMTSSTKNGLKVHGTFVLNTDNPMYARTDGRRQTDRQDPTHGILKIKKELILASHMMMYRHETRKTG